MIPIALLRGFWVKKIITSVKVSNMARCFSKKNEVRGIDTIGCRARSKIEHYFEKWPK